MNYRIKGRVTLGGSPQDSLWRRLKGKEQEIGVEYTGLAAALDLFRYRPVNIDKFYKNHKYQLCYRQQDLRDLAWVRYCKSIEIIADD